MIQTFYLFRHAEKQLDRGVDPPLTPQGLIRAERIASIFTHQPIDMVWSTSLLRAQQTAEPLAIAKNLDLRTYNPRDFKSLIHQCQADPQAHHIVIVGHQDTTPALANFLMGTDAYTMFQNEEYDRMVVISMRAWEPISCSMLRY